MGLVLADDCDEVTRACKRSCSKRFPIFELEFAAETQFMVILGGFTCPSGDFIAIIDRGEPRGVRAGRRLRSGIRHLAMTFDVDVIKR